MYDILVDELKETALKAYKAHRAAVAQAEKERAEARQLRLEQEKSALQEWLKTWMPEPAIPYVNLDNYSLDAAENGGYWEDRTTGTIMALELPGAFPIRFRVVANHRGELDFGSWGFSNWNDNYFAVPVDAKIACDDDGELYVQYHWDNTPSFKSIELAIGRAVAAWQGDHVRLQNQWLAMKAKVAEEPEEPVEPVELSVEQRIALALETIASVMGYQANY